jgi:hypothetical protein
VTEELLTKLIIFFTGLASGFFVSIASGTAGALIIPCLTIIVGVTIYQAIGTNLFVDAIIGLTAGIFFISKSKVEFKAVAIIGSIGIIFSLIGSQFTSSTPEFYLTIIIGLFLFILGINFAINGIYKNIDYINSKVSFNIFRNNKTFFYIIAGIIAGLVSGFFGMGSAGLIAVILILFFGYDVRVGVGTSLFMMFFIAASGGIGHAINNEYVIEPMVYGGIGAFIGALCGSFYSFKIDEEKLGRAIGIIISVFGLVFIIKSFYPV